MNRRRSIWVWCLVLVCAVLVSWAAVGGSTILFNASQQIARSVQLTFSEPVQIEGFGELFSHFHPNERSAKIILTDGHVKPWYSIWVRWSPEDAELKGVEWLAHGGGVQLDIAIPSDPPSIDPSVLRVADHADCQIAQLLFTGLFNVHGETGELYPELLTTWDVSSDGLEWTFSLREDALWSDGQPVTAEDARFSLLRGLDLSHGYWPHGFLRTVENARAYWQGELDDPEEVGIEAIGLHTLRIRLTEPMAHLPWVLTLPGFFPLPQHVIEKHGAQWTSPKYIVTCGPYHLVEHHSDGWFLLERNLEFFDAASVLIPRVKLWIADEEDAWGMYNAGLLDTAVVPYRSLADVPEGDTIRLVPGLPALQCQGTFFCYFNTSIPPFDDLLVRKALSAAVDRRMLAERLAQEGERTAFPTWTLAPSALLGLEPFEEESFGVPFDPAQARAWLTEAGHPNGEGLAVIHLYHSVAEKDHIRGTVIWPFLKEQWEQHLGCRVEIHQVPFDVLRAMFWDQDPPLPFFGFLFNFDYLEASNTLLVFARFILSAEYEGLLRSRVGPLRRYEFDDLLQQAARSDDLEERQELYQEAERFLLEEEVLALSLCRFAVHVASRSYLERSYNDWLFPDVSTWRFIPEES